MHRTIEYYDKNAKAFVGRTLTRDMSSQYARFLEHVPSGGTILDAGCGSGRDLKYFADHGYEAQGFDASISMVEFARHYSGQAVEQLRFEEIRYKEQFDGIWACASLLHVPSAKLAEILQILAHGLRPSGVMFMSLKEGEHEGEKDDRYFTFWSMDRLLSLLEQQHNLIHIDSWHVPPHPQSEESWVSVIVRRSVD